MVGSGGAICTCSYRPLCGERLGACICAEVMSLPVLTKQNIILIDHDNKSRRVHVQEWRLITCRVTPMKRVFAASLSL